MMRSRSPQAGLSRTNRSARTAIAMAFAAPLMMGQTAPVGTVFPTGAVAVDPNEYAKLPKLQRFRAFLPKAVDLSASFPVPGNQYPQPNCVAWATAYARSYLHSQSLGRTLKIDEASSPAYVYSRLRPNPAECRGGIPMTAALNMLKTEGALTLADFPSDMKQCPIAPPTLIERARNMRIDDFRAVARDRPTGDTRPDWQLPLRIDDVKGALARRVPVVFAMPVNQAFFDVRGPAVFNAPPGSAGSLHAMAMVGYDDERQAFRVINSYGIGWGDKGFAWISYATVRALAGEAYALEVPPAPVRLIPPQERFDAGLRNICGTIRVSRSGGRRVIDGFGGPQADLDRLKDAAMAVSPDTIWNVVSRPFPQCEAETTLATALQVKGAGLSLTTSTGAPRSGDPIALRGGERFGITAETTASMPFLSIVYIQKDGTAVELYRDRPATDGRGRRSVTVGTGGAQAVGFEVAPPFGDELLVAIASKQPFFGSELSTYETEREFLSGLRKKLIGTPNGSVSAAVLRLRSEP